MPRVTPPHKRGSVKEVKNYRPLSVLINLSVYFEKTVDPQFEAWASAHIPHNQFGFFPGTSTTGRGGEKIRREENTFCVMIISPP